ncbi:MAG: hypothetical protein OYG31_01275, partial [Candidatus Kaiserbacteria bacterium]|nr:hypothetical protein [Candidatus Kaiserbacteria bacterium]
MITIPFRDKVRGRQLLISLIAGFLVFTSLTTVYVTVFAQTARTVSDTVLLGNVHEATSPNTNQDLPMGFRAIGQYFRTGSNEVKLSKITMYVSTKGAANARGQFRLHRKNASENYSYGHSSRVSVNVDVDLSNLGRLDVVFSPALTLTANTEYVLLMTNRSSDARIRLQQTQSTDLDTSSQPGWEFTGIKEGGVLDGFASITDPELFKMELVGTVPEGVVVKNPPSPASSQTFRALLNMDTSDSTHFAYYRINNSGTSACPQTDDPTNNGFSTTYTSGTGITFNSESDNGKTVCFIARSTSSIPVAQGVYNVLSEQVNIDATVPVVTVTGPADTSAAQSKTVSAVDGDDNINSPTTWHYVRVADTKTSCVAADFSGTLTEYTEGQTVTLDAESYNDGKICFRSEDAAGNFGYGISAPVGGIDVTAPRMHTAITTNHPNSIDVQDNDLGATTMHYVKYSTSDSTKSCDSTAFTGSESAYTEGVRINFTEADNGMTACFRSEDAAGNRGYLSHAISGIDTIAPSVTVTLELSSARIKANDTETSSTIVYVKLTDSPTVACASSVDFSGATTYTEGEWIPLVVADNGKKFCFRSTDSKNNVGYALSGAISGIVDVPTVTVTNPADTNPAKTKTLSAVDDYHNTNRPTTWHRAFVTNTEDCEDADFSGTPTAYTEGQTITLNDEANNNKRICFRSVNGSNTGYGLSDVINGIDVTAPTITITNPNTNPAQSKVVSAADGDSTTTTWHSAKVSDANCDATDFAGSESTYTEGHDITLSAEGDNGKRICFRSVDRAGNAAFAISNAIAGIDTTAPIITVTNPTGTGGAQNRVVSAADNDGGTTTWHYIKVADSSCDATDFAGSESTYTEGHDITLSAEGDNGKRICFRSEDQAGNIDYAISNEIGGIDTTAPTITITNPNTNPAQSKIVSAVDDDGGTTTWHYIKVADSSCDATDFAGSESTYTEGHDITLSAEGDNGKRICFRSEDQADNTTFAISNAIAGIDTTAPTITITNPNTNPATSKIVTAAD